MNTSTCQWTGKNFSITESDQAFLRKISPIFEGQPQVIPTPTLCPEERLRRRLAFRNERHLYNRTCDLSGKPILSIYRPDSDLTVYDQPVWWSDDWIATDFEMKFDFEHTFGEQFYELQKRVPRMNLMQERNENSAYTNNTSNLQDSYMLFSSDYNQKCFHGTQVMRSKDCIDNYMIGDCQSAYQCVYSQKISNSSYIYFSENCRDSHYLFDCQNCNHCFLSTGLRNKEYYIQNKKHTKEEYESKMQSLNTSSSEQAEKIEDMFASIVRSYDRLYMNRRGRVINSSGDFLTNANNCENCFDAENIRDSKNVLGVFDINNCQDCTYIHGEWAYELCECVPNPSMSAFCMNTYSGTNLFYTDLCMNSCKDCFGCVGLKKGQNCIFNTALSQHEYETLASKIIAHMRSTGEWGEFFDPKYSLFAYNETEAHEVYPLPQEEVLKKGWKWKEETAQDNSSQSYYTPLHISEYDEQIVDPKIARTNIDACTKGAIQCKFSKKPFRIIGPELAYYIENKLPIPILHPEVRHKKRIQFRNPRKTRKTKCDACPAEIETTYEDGSKHKVLCETCYQNALY